MEAHCSSTYKTQGINITSHHHRVPPPSLSASSSATPPTRSALVFFLLLLCCLLRYLGRPRRFHLPPRKNPKNSRPGRTLSLRSHPESPPPNEHIADHALLQTCRGFGQPSPIGLVRPAKPRASCADEYPQADGRRVDMKLSGRFDPILRRT
ncbi:hypothetical protein C8R46DRAFT_1098397 [Mycena filopes]|nr:hypothetical protein C8R46DRAFT_1098397 [Mycena filopes]